MTGLIARLEAEVGTRELDGEIALLLGWKKRHKGWAHWISPDGAENQHVPFFTTSIDDALTLVPEGWSVKLYIHPDESHADVYKLGEVEHGGETLTRTLLAGPLDGSVLEGGDAVARATCIAALKAREAT